MFAYDASLGTGLGEVKPDGDSRVSLVFDPATLDIPSLNFTTTKVLGLPIPPPLQIAIDASELKVCFIATCECAHVSFQAIPDTVVNSMSSPCHSCGQRKMESL